MKPLLFVILCFLSVDYFVATVPPNCASIPPSMWCQNDALSKQCGFDKYCERYKSATRNQRINITLLSEALCPDCQHWIVDIFYPNIYKPFKDFINIEIIPYGNARINGSTITCQHGEIECRINRFESCLIDAVETQEQYVPLIYCMEEQLRGGSVFDKAVSRCYRQMSVPEQTQTLIQSCLVTSIGDKLQKKAAEQTANIWPEKHRFVPWLIFNGVSLEHSQSWASIVPNLICDWYNGDVEIPACKSLIEVVHKSASFKTFN